MVEFTRLLILRSAGSRFVGNAGMAVLALLLAISTSSAVDETEPATAPIEIEQQLAAEHPAGRQDAARRAYLTGIVMLGGILIVGVALVAAVLLWGHRTRRIARQSLPGSAPRDDLWFLKSRPVKPAPAAPAPPMAGPDSEVDS